MFLTYRRLSPLIAKKKSMTHHKGADIHWLDLSHINLKILIRPFCIGVFNFKYFQLWIFLMIVFSKLSISSRGPSKMSKLSSRQTVILQTSNLNKKSEKLFTFHPFHRPQMALFRMRAGFLTSKSKFLGERKCMKEVNSSILFKY